MKNLIILALGALIVLGNAGCSKDNANDTPAAQSAKITRIELRDFPAFQPNGADWDTWTAWPDIYLTIQSLVGSYQTTYVDECTGGSTITWSNLSIMLNDLDYTWYIDLYDYDSGGSDSYMAGIDLSFSLDSRQSRPSYVNFSNGDVYVRLYLTWYD